MGKISPSGEGASTHSPQPLSPGLGREGLTVCGLLVSRSPRLLRGRARGGGIGVGGFFFPPSPPPPGGGGGGSGLCFVAGPPWGGLRTPRSGARTGRICRDKCAFPWPPGGGGGGGGRGRGPRPLSPDF